MRGRPEDVDWALGELREAFAHGRARPRAQGGRRRLDARDRPGRRARRARACWPSRAPRRCRPRRPRRWRSSPTCSRSRGPEVARIRGVASDSATATLLERGLIEESGRSQFGAVLYRTTPLFLKLFGLGSLDELPDPAQWDPTPEEQGELRDRLLRAGEARAGVAPPSTTARPPSLGLRRGELAAGRVDVAAARQADGDRDAVLLEHRAERRRSPRGDEPS